VPREPADPRNHSKHEQRKTYDQERWKPRS
jgi:hypothetical protein